MSNRVFELFNKKEPKQIPIHLQPNYRPLHLDSEYKNRYQLFKLADGTVEDSRVKNWRQVEWEKVIEIITHLNGKEYCTTGAEKQSFHGFMIFRWEGQQGQRDEQGKPAGYTSIKIWTVGWTDGENCYLTNFNFKSGQILNSYVAPLNKYKKHVHPRLKIYKKFFPEMVLA